MAYSPDNINNLLTMKKLVLLLCVCALTSYVSAQEVKSGFFVAGSYGIIWDEAPKSSIMNLSWEDNSSAWGISAGYRWRLMPKEKPFFFDIDAFLTYKRAKYKFGFLPENYDPSDPNKKYDITPAIKDNYFSLSLSPSFNYKIYKGLYAGVGIEPTLYYIKKADSHWKFDLPVTARVGYDFDFIDIAIGYKYGLFNSINSDYFSSGKMGCWQVQVFIPF